MNGVGYLCFSLTFVVVGCRFYHVSYDDECLVAKHLFQKIKILGGIGCAEMFAVVEDGVAASGIGLCEFALHDFRGFLVERIRLRHRLEIYLRKMAGLSCFWCVRLPVCLFFRLIISRSFCGFFCLSIHQHLRLLPVVFWNRILVAFREYDHTLAVDKSLSLRILLAEPELPVAETGI